MATPAPAPDFQYDVFVSYSHVDRDWVQRQLLPRLRDAGLNAMYDDLFEVGVPSVINMERAVEGSRHTLLVLTPEWVQSQWTEFEQLLAATQDPSGRRRRLIPLLLRACEPPPRIAMLTRIELTQPTEVETAMARLLRSLAQRLDAATATPASAITVPPPSEPARVETVRRGLEALGELVKDDTVRQAVVAYSIHFADASHQIEILSSYKAVHDLLHRLQHDCYEPMSLEASRIADSEEARDNLLAHGRDLQDLVEELDDLIARGTFTGKEPSRIRDELAAVQESLAAALAAEGGAVDGERLGRALWRLNRLLALEPPRINDLLNYAARALNLEKLAATMSTVGGRLREIGLRSEQVDQFQQGVEALGRLAGTLRTLVDDHDRWQCVERELRRIEGDLARSLDELEYSWPQLKLQVEPLCAGSSESWAQSLRTDGEKLDATLADRNPAKIRQCFRSFRRQAGRRFFRVDDKLKSQCFELREAGEPLAAVLRILG